MEVELKYLLPKGIDKYSILNDDEIKKLFVPETDEVLDMKAFYFDTKDYDLKKNGLSFRIRYEGSNLVLTTKYGGGSSNGLHEREEININVSEEFLKNPSVEIFNGYAVYDEFKKALKDKEIEKMLEMNYERDELNIDNGRFNAVLSIDEGEIVTNKGNDCIFELEIEQISGSTEEMIKFGEYLAQKYGLIPCNKSKLERGFEKMV